MANPAIDILQIGDFLDAAACASLRAELEQASGGAATLLGEVGERAVQPLVRRTTRAAMPSATHDRVTALLTARIGEIASRFGVALVSCEEPQFLRYRAGDFFVAHQDGNTPLIHDESRFRKVSAVLFLSTHSEHEAPGTYGGGALVLHGPFTGPDLRVPLTPAPGTLICFRAETTHEVLPVTHGERFTVVTWYRAATS